MQLYALTHRDRSCRLCSLLQSVLQVGFRLCSDFILFAALICAFCGCYHSSRDDVRIVSTETVRDVQEMHKSILCMVLILLYCAACNLSILVRAMEINSFIIGFSLNEAGALSMISSITGVRTG